MHIVAPIASRTKAALDELRSTAHATHAQDLDFQRSLVAVQRQALAQVREATTYDDEVVRKVESMLDLEEARLNG